MGHEPLRIFVVDVRLCGYGLVIVITKLHPARFSSLGLWLLSLGFLVVSPGFCEVWIFDVVAFICKDRLGTVGIWHVTDWLHSVLAGLLELRFVSVTQELCTLWLGYVAL